MDGKIKFGCDFIYMMNELMFSASDSEELEYNPVTDAASKLFLVQWGLSPDEVDKANELLWEKVESKKLDPFPKVIERIAEHCKKDRRDIEQLLIQLAAIGFLDYHISEYEDQFVSWFQNIFDLRRSEFVELTTRGTDLAIALNYFGSAYAKSKGAEID